MAESPTVLVLEDEGIVAEDIRQTLEGLGYTVVGIVASGEEAIAEAERLAPRLVLADLVVDGPMSGLEAARRIRDRWGIPTVFLTSCTDAPTRALAMEASAYGYVSKPFEASELEAAIESALRRQELGMRLAKAVWPPKRASGSFALLPPHRVQTGT